MNKSLNKKAGLTIGTMAIVVALITSSITLSQYMTDSESNKSTRTDVFMSETAVDTLILQSAQIQSAVSLLDEKTNISWTDVASKSGKISLANSAVDYTSVFKLPSTARPLTGSGSTLNFNKVTHKNLTWSSGSVWTTATNVITNTASTAVFTDNFAWVSELDIRTCKAINNKLGLAAQPSTATFTVAAATSQRTLAAGNVSYTRAFNRAQPTLNVYLLSDYRASLNALGKDAACFTDNTFIVRIANRRVNGK
jgi:hypothetical protein